jgi:AcrR family transcriptional regulator
MNLTTRDYNMELRATKAAQTEKRILDAAHELWLELPYPAITLEKVAERACVTVRTILRKFESKEGLFIAGIEHEEEISILSRNEDPSKLISETIASLLDEYEQMGDASIRTIMASDSVTIAQKILDKARNVHRIWCEKIFAAYLPAKNSPHYTVRLHAFIAATEFYLWKLLRRDIGLSQEETLKVFENMIEGLILKYESKKDEK